VAGPSRVQGPAPHIRRTPRGDLVNVLEYEEQAELVLPPAVFARVAGGSRSAFDRVTIRPRMMVPMARMDLGLTLFGDAVFAPIVVGPIAYQDQLHKDGERATVKGAGAARVPVVISSHSSLPIEALAAGSATPIWFQVFAADARAISRARAAIKAGSRAVCITVGAAPAGEPGRFVRTTAERDWPLVASIRRSLNVPVIVKGVATPAAAKLALQHDLQGIVVSNHGGLGGRPAEPLLLSLPRIVEIVGGRMPVLVDGSIRRGTDVLKALALGAAAVLVGRPVAWGLAAYGSDGVQGVLEMLQTELARYMAMSGRATLASIDSTLVRVHRA
jgi:4-hydroxymandelate oxidase